jgi:hypothetical protein
VPRTSTEYFDRHLLRFPPEPRVPSLASVTFVKFSVLVPKLTHLPSQCMHTYIHIHISSADILRLATIRRRLGYVSHISHP